MSSGFGSRNEANVKLAISDETEAGLRQAESRLRRFGNRVSDIGRRLFAGGAAASGLGTALLLPLQRSAVTAGDFNEEINRANVVMGRLSQQAQDFAESFARPRNRDVAEILGGTTSFFTFLSNAGLAEDAAFSLSKRLVALSTDFASIENLDQSTALRGFLSALTGENALAERGLPVRASDINAELQRLGIDKTNNDLSELQKRLVRASVLFNRFSKVEGDALNTAQEFANSQRGVEAATNDLQRAFGGAITGDLARFNNRLIEILRSTSDVVEKNPELVRSFSRVATGLAVGGGVIGGVGLTLIGAGAALSAMGRSATTAIAPVGSVGVVGASVGRTFGALGGVVTSPFILLGQTVRTVAPAVTAMAAVLGGLPTVTILAATGLTVFNVANQSLTRTLNQLRDAVTLSSAGFGVLSEIYTGLNEKLQGLNQSFRVAIGLATDLIRLTSGEITAEDLRENIGRRVLDAPIITRTGQDPNVAFRDLLPKIDKDELGQQFREAFDNIERIVRDVAPQVKETFDELKQDVLGGEAFDKLGEGLDALKAKLSEKLPAGAFANIETEIEKAVQLAERFKVSFSDGFDSDAIKEFLETQGVNAPDFKALIEQASGLDGKLDTGSKALQGRAQGSFFASSQEFSAGPALSGFDKVTAATERVASTVREYMTQNVDATKKMVSELGQLTATIEDFEAQYQ